MRTVYIDAKIKLVLKVDEGVEIADIMGGLDLNVSDPTNKADVEDVILSDYEITDSK